MPEEDAASPTPAEEKEKKTAKKSATKNKKALSLADENKSRKKRSRIDNPSTADMIIEALENLHEPNGSSVQAIKGWICSNYHSVRPDMLKFLLRNALLKGIDKGIFVRSKGVTTTAVLSGSYCLCRPSAKLERDEALRSSSRIRRLQGWRVSKKHKARLPFGTRRRKVGKKNLDNKIVAKKKRPPASSEANEDEPVAPKKARSTREKKKSPTASPEASEDEDKPVPAAKKVRSTREKKKSPAASPASSPEASEDETEPVAPAPKKARSAREKKKSPEASPASSPEGSEDETEPAVPAPKKARSAREKSNKDSDVTDSPPNVEEKPTEKTKGEKKKFDPVKSELPKNEAKNENAKSTGRRSRKKAS